MPPGVVPGVPGGVVRGVEESAHRVESVPAPGSPAVPGSPKLPGGISWCTRRTGPCLGWIRARSPARRQSLPRPSAEASTAACTRRVRLSGAGGTLRRRAEARADSRGCPESTSCAHGGAPSRPPGQRHSGPPPAERSGGGVAERPMDGPPGRSCRHHHRPETHRSSTGTRYGRPGDIRRASHSPGPTRGGRCSRSARQPASSSYPQRGLW